jgi:capsular polysaccharide biosynthesis protein
MRFLKNKYTLWTGVILMLIGVNAGYNKYKRYLKKKPVYDYVLPEGQIYHELNGNDFDALKEIGVTHTLVSPSRTVKFDTKIHSYNFSDGPPANGLMHNEYMVPAQSYLTVDSVIAVTDGSNQDKPWFIKGNSFFRPYEEKENRPEIIMNTISADGTQLTLNPSARKVRRIKGTTLFFKGSQNIFHHLAESLPSLITTSFDSKKYKIAVSHDQDLIMDTLKYLGVPDKNIIYLHPKTSYEFERLIIPSVLYGGSNTHLDPDLLGKTLSLLKKHASKHTSLFSKSAGKYVYVSRADAARRVLNEKDLVEELKKRGFEIVIPGKYNLADQIKLFKDVKIAIAPHGAGLTNLFFSGEQKALIEFFSNSYIDSGFIRISRINGAEEYHQLIFTPDEKPSEMNTYGKYTNYTVDVQKVLEVVDKVLEKYK